MRLSTLVVAIFMTASGVARADDLGLHGDFEAGLVAGGARIHDAGGALLGVTLAAGVTWNNVSLLGTIESDDFTPTDTSPNVTVHRFGWRARYDLPLLDRELRPGGWRSRYSWYFDAGTGEQLISWNASDSQRNDIELGTGFLLQAYGPHEWLRGPPMGVNFGFELTSAPALAAIPTVVARDTVTAPVTLGRENAYLFTFSCHFL